MEKIARFILVFSVFVPLATAQSPANWTKQIPPTSPPAREDHAMAYDSAHGEVVLFGGAPSSLVVFNDTWVWNGANWTQKIPALSPPARTFSSMVYDSARGEVVLFGGMVGGVGVANDTWVWNGTNWSQKFPALSPPARAYHAMAYDSAHQQVVLFGGSGNSASVGNDTWVWNGSNWAQKFPALSPHARSAHALAYDSAHGQVVLFGGAEQVAGPGNDTWVWDGSNWTQKVPLASPPGRSRVDNAMAYDSVHGQVVLFGGLSNATLNAINDTWVWNGANWIEQSPLASPPQRYYLATAYDSAHNLTVLFGGTNGVDEFNDTWTWNGGPAPAPVIGSVVNGASFVGGGVVPGEIATIFGTNLTSADGINLTSSLPLPKTFLNVSVMVNKQPVPLFAVDNVDGRQQINFQVPWEAASGPNATVEVENNGATSASASVPVLAAQPGIFAILHANFQLADAGNPAKPGETVLIYCTGLGKVSSTPADGAPGHSQPTTTIPTVTMGDLTAIVNFSGLAPGFVGLYQVNAEVPEALTAGNQGVVVTLGGVSSKSLVLAVQ